MQLEYVAGKAQQHPFYGNFYRSTQQKPSEVHILLRHGKYTLCLDAAIDTQQLAALCVDFFLHRLPLLCKTSGDVKDLTALLQWLLAGAADTLRFERAILPPVRLTTPIAYAVGFLAALSYNPTKSRKALRN